MTTIDFVKAEIANCYHETYYNGCEELMNTIVELKSTISEFEQDIAENSPLVFVEFSEGTDCDRDEIVANTKQTFDTCFLEAKADWRNWKGMILERLYTMLESRLDLVSADRAVVTPLLEKYQTLIAQSTNYVEEMTANTRMIQEEYDAKVEELNQARQMLLAENPSKLKLIAELKSQIQEVDRQTEEADEELSKLGKSAMECSCRIEQAEKMCANLVVFEPADLAAVRGQYNIALMTHRWRPSELTLAKQSWVFDDAIQVEFVKYNKGYRLSTAVFTPTDGVGKSVIFGKQSIETKSLLVEIQPERLSAILAQFDKTQSSICSMDDMKMVMQKLAMLWESMKALARDRRKANRYTSSPVEWGDDLFSIKTTFFSKAKATHMECILDFSNQKIITYPFGGVKCSLNLTYGSIKFLLLIRTEEIREAVNEVENGPEYASRCCRLIKSLFDL